jgi:hypothetical protein
MQKTQLFTTLQPQQGTLLLHTPSSQVSQASLPSFIWPGEGQSLQPHSLSPGRSKECSGQEAEPNGWVEAFSSPVAKEISLVVK